MQPLTSKTLEKLSKLKARKIVSHFHPKPKPPIASSPLCRPRNAHFSTFTAQQFQKMNVWFGGVKRFIHTDAAEEMVSGDDPKILLRFVRKMRENLMAEYPDLGMKAIEGMLFVIVGKLVSELEKGGFGQIVPSGDFSEEDSWKTVWNVVLRDMEIAKMEEKMRNILQEFYQNLERKEDEEKAQGSSYGIGAVEQDSPAEDPKLVALPKRRGKINYNIYGLDLSDSKWYQVADKIHEAEKIISPQEPKHIDGKCKIITEKILSSQAEDDYSPLIAEWVKLLQPSRVDWINLLDRLKNRNPSLYLKIAEHVLGEESFQTNVRDYLKLIDAHARDNRLEDVERIIKKMSENGIYLIVPRQQPWFTCTAKYAILIEHLRA